ncbi:dihydropteroate synthase [Nonomuraea sediminis]|uniref:dihydropteroate synthase n=1 Tax=Nonomuraea sediminis TaxID=2835864 RepID=UPI001BDC0BB1|nr:dihydropteroate synthase [Nonomuraea sediminis]
MSLLKPYYPELIEPVRTVGAREFDFGKHVVLMGIVNRTPNSGLDPNMSLDLKAAVQTAEKAIREGAEWVDVGGRSFRADQPELSSDEEIRRVVPVIEAIRAQSDVVISVDTHLPDVALAAVRAGADVINDTHGLQSPGMVEVVRETGASVIITHSLGGPHTPVHRPAYNDVVTDVRDFLLARVNYARENGIAADRIYIDPGHDLNKNTHHSLAITRGLPTIAEIGYPVLVATSRKHFIRESLGVEKTDSAALNIGTIVANTMCAYLGARIVRVHEVAENVTAMRTVEGLLGFRGPEAPIHNM